MIDILWYFYLYYQLYLNILKQTSFYFIPFFFIFIFLPYDPYNFVTHHLTTHLTKNTNNKTQSSSLRTHHSLPSLLSYDAGERENGWKLFRKERVRYNKNILFNNSNV